MILEVELVALALSDIGEHLGSQSRCILPVNLVSFFDRVTTEEFEDGEISVLGKNSNHPSCPVYFVHRPFHRITSVYYYAQQSLDHLRAKALQVEQAIMWLQTLFISGSHDHFNDMPNHEKQCPSN